MRNLFLTAASAVLLMACAAENPNDGAQYFDSVNPNATELKTGDVPKTAGPANAGNADISNTQNFRAIKAQETIASDKAKLAALKSTYQQVDPDSVQAPRLKSGGINLPAYALKQTNSVGERVYQRANSGLSNCSRYRNDPDAAQRAFLQAGGPERDNRRLDPDGDGFACSWNPDFYRKMLNPAG